MLSLPFFGKIKMHRYMQNSRLSHLLLKNSGHFYKIWGILKLVALGPEILCTD